jgi:uncharacterized protein (TIGR03083 family)
LARAAAAAGFDAPVPTCPGWQVRDLLWHMGAIHRWAQAHIEERRQEPMPKGQQANLMATHPDDDDLLEWLRQGKESLCQVLANAPTDLRCWTFLPAPSPRAFWARRQAHETEIHRADAELATHSSTVSFEAAAAADGIEEMLFGFAARRRRLDLDSTVRIALLPQDRPGGWLVQLGPEGVAARSGVGPYDCRVKGATSDLYLVVWNRPPSAALEIDGDRGALEDWQRTIKVQ